MAVQAAIGTIESPALSSKLFFFTKEFLKNSLGWTVGGSADGTTGGMDGVDRILVDTQFEAVLTNWLVMTSPDSEMQCMFTKDNNGSDNNGSVYFCPQGDYAGGDATTQPTSSSATAVRLFGPSDDIIGISPTRLHICGSDSDDPYWWAVLGNPAGNPLSGTGGMICIAMDNIPVGGGGRYWMYLQENGGFEGNLLDTQTTSEVTSRGLAQQEVGGVAQPTPATRYVRDSSSIVIPGGIQVDGNFFDLGVPVIFASNGPGRYAGTTDRMLWTGTPRARLTTFNNRARICFGDVTFPWDGTTAPIP